MIPSTISTVFLLFTFIIFQAQVEQINKTLSREYRLRRQTLLTRLDVTVRSFEWSEVGKVNYLLVITVISDYKVNTEVLGQTGLPPST